VSENGETLRLTRGDTALVMYAAGSTELTGGIDAIRCLPPLAEDA
jgi:hypothetical protein